MKIEKRDSDGTYQRWNWDLYVAHRSAKPKEPARDVKSVDHPFLGKKFLREDGYVVFTQIVKHWYGGYYYFGVYEVNDSGSHGTACIENINCINDTILELIEDFKKEYTPV